MSKTISNDHRPCPACNFSSVLYRGEKNGFKTLECKACHTWYISHLPTSDSEEDYDKYYSPTTLVTPDFIRRRLDEITASFDIYRKGNRLLDIGFGAGGLLQAAVRAGWKAEGIEVSLPAVEHARTSGLNVCHGELAEVRYPDNSFDVVTAVEVLEHVPEPQQIVHEVARILRPGGLFWATTPHSRGISARILKMQWSVVSPPEHLQLLSSKGAGILLASGGFRTIRVATQGANPYEILHVLRSNSKNGASSRHDSNGESDSTFSRNETGCQLNEFLVSSPSRLALKNAINGLLSASRMGDSLKIRGIL